jgi:hypothetical protein
MVKCVDESSTNKFSILRALDECEVVDVENALKNDNPLIEGKPITHCSSLEGSRHSHRIKN